MMTMSERMTFQHCLVSSFGVGGVLAAVVSAVPTVVAPPRQSYTPARHIAVDFCRGLGLWMLFVDHFEPDFWSHFTMGHFGFSDFAEVFVFLSGFTNAAMYRRSLATGGLARAARKLRDRLARLYVAHIASMVASLAVLAAAEAGGLLLQRPEFYLWEDAPAKYAVRMLTLMYAPSWFGLLPLYIVVAPFTLLAAIAMRRRPFFTLAASFALWSIAQSGAFGLPTAMDRGAMYFRPLAWQFLFVIGVGAEAYWERLKRAAGGRLVQAGAAAVVLVSFAAKAAVATGAFRSRIFALAPALIPFLVDNAGKANLEPFRLVHFVSLAMLAIAIPWDWSKALEFTVVRAAVGVGRDSLLIFCVTLVLTTAGNVLLENYQGGKLAQLACCALGIGVMCAIAFMRGNVPARA
jgi:hypothetical protein